MPPKAKEPRDPPGATRVRVGHISLPLYPHPKGWRFAWKDPASGTWRYVSRRDRKVAMAAAAKKAAELARDDAGLAAAINRPETAALLHRVLAMGVTHADLDLLAERRDRPAAPLGEAVEKFLAAKAAARGPSARNVRGLRSQLRGLEAWFGTDRPLADISPADIEAWMDATADTPGTRRHRRSAAVTLFRWCRSRELLPDAITAAERTERVIMARKPPGTYTPDELAAILAVCPRSHLPWLLLCAWAGLRTSEVYRERGDGEKDVIRWGDLDFAARSIHIRHGVGKVGTRQRFVPMSPQLSAALVDLRPEACAPSSPIGLGAPPYRLLAGAKRKSVTEILGDPIGGWRRNHLRHSWISYRAAIVGLAQTAMEAGNSESEARKSYHEGKPKKEAKAWFAVAPVGTSSEPPPDSKQ